MSRLGAWLASLSSRERTLLAAAAAVSVLVVAGRTALALRDDLATLRVRVAARERELTRVRRAGTVLRRGALPAADSTGESLLARLEATADATVGRERIADMTPAGGPVEDGVVEERASLGVRGASLADTVRLLHALEAGNPPLHVVRLELRKHPDDAARFDATVEVAALGPVP